MEAQDSSSFYIAEESSLPFPESLPEFQRLFPDETACAKYLERARWPDGFECPRCKTKGEPFRFANRPHVLRCRKRACHENTRLTAGTVMEKTHIPLSVWFWGAYLMTSQTQGMSAVQFQRQLGLSRFETAFQILHKLRAAMIRTNQDLIGGEDDDHVEVDEAWMGGKTRGKGHGVTDQILVSGAVEVRWRKGKSQLSKRRSGRYAGRVRLAVVPDRSRESLCGFVQNAVKPNTMVVTDGWRAYKGLEALGFKPIAFPANGDPEVTEENLPIIHLVFSNLKTWIRGIHHGVSPKHLQAYLNEFSFRFNRRFYPFNAFASLLGIAGGVPSPTNEGLYSGEWEHPSCITRQQLTTGF